MIRSQTALLLLRVALVGVAHPAGLPGVLAARLPSGTTFSPTIRSSVPLLIQDYSIDPGWSLEPSASPGTTLGSVVLHTAAPGRYSSWLHLNTTAGPHSIWLEATVVASGVHSQHATLHFGSLATAGASKSVPLRLLNAGDSPIHIAAVQSVLPDSLLRIEFDHEAGVLIAPGSRARVARVVYTAPAIDSDLSGHLVVHTNDSSPIYANVRVPITGNTRLGSITLVPEHSAAFLRGTDRVERWLDLRSSFRVPVALYAARSTDPTSLEMVSFTPVTLHPGSVGTQVVQVACVPNAMQEVSIVLETNVSTVSIPFFTFSGELHPISDEIDFGLQGTQIRKQMNVELSNPNPVPLGVESVTFSPEIAPLVRVVNLAELEEITAGSSGILVLESAMETVGEVVGSVVLRTRFSERVLPVKLHATEGQVVWLPSGEPAAEWAELPSAFPGKLTRLNLTATSTFPVGVSVDAVSSTDPRIRVELFGGDGAVGPGGVDSVFGQVVCQPTRDVLPGPIDAQVTIAWSTGAIVSQRFRCLVVEASLLQGALAEDKSIDFGLVRVGTQREALVEVENPSDHVLRVELSAVESHMNVAMAQNSRIVLQPGAHGALGPISLVASAVPGVVEARYMVKSNLSTSEEFSVMATIGYAQLVLATEQTTGTGMLVHRRNNDVLPEVMADAASAPGDPAAAEEARESETRDPEVEFLLQPADLITPGPEDAWCGARARVVRSITIFNNGTLPAVDARASVAAWALGEGDTELGTIPAQGSRTIDVVWVPGLYSAVEADTLVVAESDGVMAVTLTGSMSDELLAELIRNAPPAGGVWLRSLATGFVGTLALYSLYRTVRMAVIAGMMRRSAKGTAPSATRTKGNAGSPAGSAGAAGARRKKDKTPKGKKHVPGSVDRAAGAVTDATKVSSSARAPAAADETASPGNSAAEQNAAQYASKGPSQVGDATGTDESSGAESDSYDEEGYDSESEAEWSSDAQPEGSDHEEEEGGEDWMPVQSRHKKDLLDERRAAAARMVKERLEEEAARALEIARAAEQARVRAAAAHAAAHAKTVPTGGVAPRSPGPAGVVGTAPVGRQSTPSRVEQRDLLPGGRSTLGTGRPFVRPPPGFHSAEPAEPTSLWSQSSALFSSESGSLFGAFGQDQPAASDVHPDEANGTRTASGSPAQVYNPFGSGFGDLVSLARKDE